MLKFAKIIACCCVALAAGMCVAEEAPENAAPEEAKIFRIGIIGTDTSHVGAFTNVINGQKTGVYTDMQVTAVYKAGMPDNPGSWDRVEKIAAEAVAAGLKPYASLDEMLENVDGVLIECVDGRPHVFFAQKVFAARKPVFIDKPLAGNLTDAVRIANMAEAEEVPFFSASSLRYATDFQKLLREKPLGKIHAVDAWSPGHLNDQNPGFYWYGIHGVETLFTLMGGRGCVSVSCTSAENYDVAVGVWSDGRVGTFRGIRAGGGSYGAVVFGDKTVQFAGKYDGYKPLCDEICKFFATGVVPIDPQETLEIMAFMTAAEESRKLGGTHVTLASVLEKAKNATVRTFDLRIAEDGSLTLDGLAVAKEDLAEKVAVPKDAEDVATHRVVIYAHPAVTHEAVMDAVRRLGSAVLEAFIVE